MRTYDVPLPSLIGYCQLNPLMHSNDEFDGLGSRLDDDDYGSISTEIF